jgi:hypothetical protein
MKTKTVKENIFAMLLCLALILPSASVWAQDSGDSWADLVDWGDTSDDTRTTAPETAAPETPAPKTATETAVPKDAPKTTTETTAPKTAEPKTQPKTSGQTPSIKAPKIQSTFSLTAIINTVIGYIAKIGGIFGKSTGTRIGGTSVSAIAMLVIAKLIQDRGPDWLRWLLYLSGGTMVAGSGANITQLIMRFLS